MARVEQNSKDERHAVHLFPLQEARGVKSSDFLNAFHEAQRRYPIREVWGPSQRLPKKLTEYISAACQEFSAPIRQEAILLLKRYVYHQAPAQPAWTAQRAYAVLVSPRNNLVQVWKASRPWEPADHGCTRLQAAQAADVSPHELAGALASLSQLRELHLSSLQLGDARMQEIAEMFSLGTFPHLQRLYLAHNSLGAAGATALAKALRVLNLPENAIRSAGTEALAGALISGATPLLEQLVLAGNGIGTIGARAIATALKQLPRLQDLHLARNALGSQGAVAISRALKLDHAPALEWLSLTENAIGDMGLQALSASVARMPRLEWLDLELNGITDIGASALGQALSQTAGLGLRELDMRGNKVGEHGSLRLEQAKANVLGLQFWLGPMTVGRPRAEAPSQPICEPEPPPPTDEDSVTAVM
ncbi:Nlrc3 [Symbiodinium microadriaticum]|nr:Nlrc3 [Symbiodinium microadriaticum]